MPAFSPPAIDTEEKQFLHEYLTGDHDRLSARFLEVFQRIEASDEYLPEADQRHCRLRFLKIFLTLFTQPDYLIPDQYILPFINRNELISNLVAATPFGNTDAFLEILRSQPSNFVKILTLYSLRNQVRFSVSDFFDTNPKLGSYWYNAFCSAYKTGLVSAEGTRHLVEHLGCRDVRMTLAPNIQEGYFACTYLGGDLDRQVKPFLNSVVRRSLTGLKCANTPNPRKIAVISDLWFPEHSVYRICAAFVEELRKSFHLTFFHSAMARDKLDVDMFDEVHRLPVENGTMDLRRLAVNDFQAVFFPDIGMTTESIMLANHRIAPIQFCSLGHSVSTFGADIDYFISGADVEPPVDSPRNYSERLVLLPGMGVVHNRPRYEPTKVRKTTSDIIVNCPWMSQKINDQFLRTIRKLVDRLQRPVRLRLFPGITSRFNSYPSFTADVRAALGSGARLEIYPYCPYPQYMSLMEEGDLTLDSFHFAGCNTVAESLFLRKPTLVREGDKWYNRIGPAMLRLAGLDDLICATEDDYLQKACRLINDDSQREEYAARLRETDLDATVFSTKSAPAFVRAVQFLIANHARLQADDSKTPIRFE